MQDNNPIKDILYGYLEKITEKKIQLLVSQGKSSQLIEDVMQNCHQQIIALGDDVDENIGALAESLMHYLLTISLTSSQRKISQNNVEIDIIIPDMKTLNTKPDDSLIICFPKTSDKQLVIKRLDELAKFQPKKENIWLVLQNDPGIGYKTFEIKEKGGSFAKILTSINEFLASKKQTQFKIFKT